MEWLCPAMIAALIAVFTAIEVVQKRLAKRRRRKQWDEECDILPFPCVKCGGKVGRPRWWVDPPPPSFNPAPNTCRECEHDHSDYPALSRQQAKHPNANKLTRQVARNWNPDPGDTNG